MIHQRPMDFNMKTIWYFFILYFLFNCSNAADTLKFSVEKWIIAIDPQRESITLQNDDLGIILKDLYFNSETSEGLVKLKDWSIENGDNKIDIRTTEPEAANLEIVVTDDTIDVRGSQGNIVLTGMAIAPASRFPARVAKPEKMQRFLSDEDTDFTGANFYEMMYVPSDASHVMYLSLGLVEAPNLHALFDKPSDIVIEFPVNSILKRDSQDHAQMEVNIPLIQGNARLSLIRDYFIKVIGLPRYVPYDDTYHQTAPTGWNHWLAFFRQVTEQDIVKATDWVCENLKDYGMTHIQLDDGYDHEDHRHWDKDWDPVTFPHGPDWLANYIKSKGLTPGLWTVPYSYCVEHGKPEWFLRDDKGQVVMDYQGGGELDFSSEEVIREYWIPLFQNLKAQGWQYFKFDMGNTVRMWERYRDRFYDRSQTPYSVSLRTMQIFREIMGPQVWHTNHPDNSGGRMGFIDVAGCGRDPGPGWRQMNNFFEVISNNTYQNHIIWYSDPDCIVLRGKPTRADSAEGNHEFLSLEEAKTAASLLSLAGLQWLSGDDLTELEPERVALIKKAIPIMPIFPIDLFGRGRDPKNYPEIFDLKVNMPSGQYDAIAVTNWENKPVSRSVWFEKDLALDPQFSYLVFDCWQEQLIGHYKERINVEIPAHGTRVLIIRDKQDRPQLLATNRHITGAFSIIAQAWNESDKILQGTSETVPSTEYSLYFFVPPGMKVQAVKVNGVNSGYTLEPVGLLKISFISQKVNVDWRIRFSE
jgi:hypothetical protein